MAIYLHNPEDLRRWGHPASLYADTKAEIIAVGATVPTENEGTIIVLPGSNCVTALGEVLLINSSGVWAEI